MFEILYHPDVISEDVPRLNQSIRRRIKTAIENRLMRAPADYGKPLRGDQKSSWRLRVGDYRIAYLIETERVIILQIVHRKDAYRAGIAEARRKGLL